MSTVINTQAENNMTKLKQKEQASHDVDQQHLQDLMDFIAGNVVKHETKTGTRFEVDAATAPLPKGLTRKAFGLSVDHMNALEAATAQYTVQQWQTEHDNGVNKVRTETMVRDDLHFSAQVTANKDGDPRMTIRRTSLGPVGSSDWLAAILES